MPEWLQGMALLRAMAVAGAVMLLGVALAWIGEALAGGPRP